MNTNSKKQFDNNFEPKFAALTWIVYFPNRSSGLLKKATRVQLPCLPYHDLHNRNKIQQPKKSPTCQMQETMGPPYFTSWQGEMTDKGLDWWETVKLKQPQPGRQMHRWCVSVAWSESSSVTERLNQSAPSGQLWCGWEVGGGKMYRWDLKVRTLSTNQPLRFSPRPSTHIRVPTWLSPDDFRVNDESSAVYRSR